MSSSGQQLAALCSKAEITIKKFSQYNWAEIAKARAQIEKFSQYNCRNR